MKAKHQTLKVANNPKELLDKIEKMRDVIRPLALRDIETIKKLTGLKDINYEDIVFLKRAIRESVLSRDPNNIQILKCFSLENTLQGLCKLLKNMLEGSKIGKGEQDFTIATLVLDQRTGEIVAELEDVFDFTCVDKKFMTVLFKLEICERGTIILDLFQRDG